MSIEQSQLRYNNYYQWSLISFYFNQSCALSVIIAWNVVKWQRLMISQIMWTVMYAAVIHSHVCVCVMTLVLNPKWPTREIGISCQRLHQQLGADKEMNILIIFKLSPCWFYDTNNMYGMVMYILRTPLARVRLSTHYTTKTITTYRSWCIQRIVI